MTARLYDLCAYRAALVGRNPPRGEAEAASVLRLRRAVEADERVSAAFERLEQVIRIRCADERREIQVRGLDEGGCK